MNVSRQALQDYNEMIQDTAYNVRVNLRRMSEKQLPHRNSELAIDLNDEQEVTQECLRICEDVRSYIERRGCSGYLHTRDGSRNALETETENGSEARALTSQALNKSRDILARTTDDLQNHIGALIPNKSPKDGDAMLQLRQDIGVSNECLEVCRVASEACSQTFRRVRHEIVDRDSNQAVVNNLGDLFDIKKTKDSNSAQILGSMTEEVLRKLNNRRYSFESSSRECSFVDANDTSLFSVSKLQTAKSPGRGPRTIQAASISDEDLLLECEEKVRHCYDS